MLKWVVILAVMVGVVALVAVLRQRGSNSSPEHPSPEDSPSTPVETIEAFWKWWPTVSHDIASSIDGGRSGAWSDEISRRVEAIDPDLGWELGPGKKSRHHLAISSGGDPEGRVLAERWLSRAPAADEIWEYYAARQAHTEDPVFITTIDGVDLEIGDFRLQYDVDETRESIDVKVHHPELHRLEEGQQGLAVFLFLDGRLGEDGVERSIGEVTPSPEPLLNPENPEQFVAAVEALAEKATAERFVLLEGKTPQGQPVIASVNVAIKRVDHLLMDVHFEIHIAIEKPTAEGLNTADEGADLNAVEDGLLELLDHDAVYLGRETGRGERVIHLHAAAAGPAESRIRDWMRKHPDRDIELKVAYDPRWEVLQRW